MIKSNEWQMDEETDREMARQMDMITVHLPSFFSPKKSVDLTKLRVRPIIIPVALQDRHAYMLK